MEHLVAFMLLVGCNADGSQCAEIPVPTPSYSSLEDCNSALPLEIRLSGTYDHRVVGACTAVDEEMLSQSASIEWALNKGGELRVEVVPEADGMQVAETGNVRMASR